MAISLIPMKIHIVKGSGRNTKQGKSLKVNHHNAPNVVLKLTKSQLQKILQHINNGKKVSRVNMSKTQMSQQGKGFKKFFGKVKEIGTKIIKHPIGRKLISTGLDKLEGKLNDGTIKDIYKMLRSETGYGRKKQVGTYLRGRGLIRGSNLGGYIR
jgi:hypothetical protein